MERPPIFGRCSAELVRTRTVLHEKQRSLAMDSIIYLVGLIVIIMFILSALGLR